jgi:reactive chlorine resistance protein C
MTTLMQSAAHEQSAMSSRVEAVGRELARYGLVVVVGWIGLMKFTAHEAEGIRPFVTNSPLLSWVYGPLSVRGFSAVLGVVEVAIAILIAPRPFSPRASALGSRLAPSDPQVFPAASLARQCDKMGLDGTAFAFERC